MAKKNVDKPSYIYPVLKHEAGKCVVFELDGEQIKIELKTNESQNNEIIITKSNETLKVISEKEALSFFEIESDDHIIKVKYHKKKTFFPISLFSPNDDFIVYVDKKPLEGTLADPFQHINGARIVFFIYAALAFFSIFISESIMLFSGVLFIFLLILGLLAIKLPLFTTFLGIIYGVTDVWGYFNIFSYKISNSTGSSISFYFFVLLFKVYLAYVLFKGFIGAVEVVRLKRILSKNAMNGENL